MFIHPDQSKRKKMSETNTTKVLILGGGTAGAAIARKLEKTGLDFVLVDNKDYFDITPSIICNC